MICLLVYVFFPKLVMLRASEKVRAEKNIPRACPSFQKAWLDRAELLKTRGSRAKFRAEPRLDPALNIVDKIIRLCLPNDTSAFFST